MSIPRHVLHLKYQLSLQGMLLSPRYELWEPPDNMRTSMTRHGANRPDHTSGIAKRWDDALQLTLR